MQYITVFCGSSKGNAPIYAETAALLGKTLAESGYGLVYGGGKVGLMGIVANAVMQHGGKVIGIIPHFLNAAEGIAYDEITEVRVVDTMHERKLLMHQLSSGVIALPGGYGTMDELFEILCWAQLGLHSQPVGLLNVADYYTPLLTMVETMNRTQFLSDHNKNLLLSDTEPAALLAKMQDFKPSDATKWLDRVAL
jgi:uncharacterized protein (TIGR00730 family)